MHKIVFIFLWLMSVPAFASWFTLNVEGEVTQRHENGFVASEDKLFLIGGRGLKPVEVFSPQTNTWVQKAKTPLEMHHITPVYLNGLIWVVTGLTGKYPTESPLAFVYSYDPIMDKWQKRAAIPKERQRGCAGVTVYNNKIYIAGGIKHGHTSGTTNMVDEFNPETGQWKTLTDAPHIRDHNNLVAIDNKLIALGGRNTSVHEHNNFTAFFHAVIKPVDIYSFETKQWITLTEPLPAPAAGAGAIATQNTVYFMGGETGHLPAQRTTYSLNLKTQKWTQHKPLKTGRHGTNAAKIKNKIYIAAGSGNRGGRPELKSIEVYEIQK